MKVSIIGGSGFIGTNLCHLLDNKNIDFEIIDLKKSKSFPKNFKMGDVRILQSLKDCISGDVVINLAAVHSDDLKDKNQYHLTNVIGAENIAKVCLLKEIKKIIFTSSVAVYGFAKPGTDESGEINPFNEYGFTKFKAEEIFRSWQSKDNNSLIIVRPTVIFGEGNRGNVYNLLNQIFSKKFIMIGKGKNKKSMAYVKNLVSFLEVCIKSKANYELFNYVDHPNFTMNDLVNYVHSKLFGKKSSGMKIPYFFGIFMGYISDGIAFLLNKNLPISSIRIKKFTSSTEFLSKNIEAKGFTPPYSIFEGLDRTLKSEFISPDPSKETFFTE